MKIIIHNSLNLTLEQAVRIIHREVPLNDLAVNLTDGDAIIEPLDIEDINLFGEYGEGTSYKLLAEI